MPAKNWIEVPVFIHGIMPGEDPGPHDGEYKGLLDLVNRELGDRNKPALSWEDAIKVEWGWDSGQSTENERLLSLAERMIGKEAFEAEDEAWDFTINPLRILHAQIRKSFMYGFADLFYYVSSDGEKGVRNHVFQQIAHAVNKLPPDQNLSLTFFTHSAGTVIAHDFLYHLFGAAPGPLAADLAQKEVLAVRNLVDRGTLRVRRLFTMGSPITPLVFRADSLLLKVVKGEKIDPAGLGLRPDPALSALRWVNFWDKDDVISFPLAFNYATIENQAVVEDFYADIGDFFPAVHGKYWSSSKVAARMAEVW